MKVGWWTGLFMAMMLLTIICSVCEMQATPFTSHDMNVVQFIMNPPVMNFSNPLTGAYSLFNAGWNFIKALWNTIWFNYSFLEQSTLGQYFQMLFWCVPLGIVVMIIIALAGRGISVAGG